MGRNSSVLNKPNRSNNRWINHKREASNGIAWIGETRSVLELFKCRLASFYREPRSVVFTQPVFAGEFQRLVANRMWSRGRAAVRYVTIPNIAAYATSCLSAEIVNRRYRQSAVAICYSLTTATETAMVATRLDRMRKTINYKVCSIMWTIYQKLPVFRKCNRYQVCIINHIIYDYIIVDYAMVSHCSYE